MDLDSQVNAMDANDSNVLFVTNLQEVPVIAARMRTDGVFSVFSLCNCLFYNFNFFWPSFSDDTVVIDAFADCWVFQR